MIRAVVFDLDGTLANTAGLANRRREPSMLLGGGVDAYGNEAGPRPWSFGQKVNDLPAVLIERGYRVAIATRAPLAYSLTLVHLLQIDYEVMRASCGAGLAKADTIKELAQNFGVEPSELLYCGDVEEDALIAQAAGCAFLPAGELAKDGILGKFPSLIHLPSDPRVKWPGTSEPTPVEISDFNSAAEVYLALPGSTGWHPTVIPLIDRYLTLCDSAPVVGSVEGFEVFYNNFGLIGKWRTAMALAILWWYPMLPQRRLVQFELLRHASEVDRDTLVYGWAKNQRFGIAPRYVTRRELRHDKNLRHEYLRAVERVWPTRRGERENRLSAAVVFDNDGSIGRILADTKNYRRHRPGDRFRSGPEVQLERIDFVADLVACRIDETVKLPLVPIPSTAYALEQPGQISLRITHRVAELTDRQLIPVLRRRGEDIEVDPDGLAGLNGDRIVDLVDDQVTTGGTIDDAVAVLARSGVAVNSIYAFSANQRVLRRVVRPPVETWSDRHQLLEEYHQ